MYWKLKNRAWFIKAAIQFFVMAAKKLCIFVFIYILDTNQAARNYYCISEHLIFVFVFFVFVYLYAFIFRPQIKQLFLYFVFLYFCILNTNQSTSFQRKYYCISVFLIFCVFVFVYMCTFIFRPQIKQRVPRDIAIVFMYF